MRRVFILFLIQTGLCLGAYAQFKTPEAKNVNLVKSRVLLVPMMEEVTRTLVDLANKPDELKAYKDGVANYNEMLKSAVQEFWKFGKGVEFMTATEVKKLEDAASPKYAILKFSLLDGSVFNSRMIGPVYGSGKYTSAERAVSHKEGFGKVNIVVPMRGEVNNIISIHLPVAYPSKGDMVYALQLMQFEFNKLLKQKDYEVNEFKTEIEKNNKLLAKRTLLIESGQLESKTTLDDLKKFYTYPVEVVDYEKINEAIVNADSNYAYVQVVPIEEPNNSVGGRTLHLIHMVMDATDGKPLGKAKPSRMYYNNPADDISRKEVKEYKL